jgi:hypothetical protein
VNILLLAVVALTLSAVPGATQKRPDFTGTWVEDPKQRQLPAEERASSGGAPLSGEMPPLKIIQTADRLTIEERFRDQVTRFVYDFDGRENKNRTGAQIHTTRSRWDGSRFIVAGSIFQVTSQGEDSWKLREVRWLTPKGEMVVDRTQVDEDGKPRTVTLVFRKG